MNFRLFRLFRLSMDPVSITSPVSTNSGQAQSWQDLDAVVHDLDFPGFTDDEVQDYCEANPSRPPCQARAHPAAGGPK